MEQDYKQEVTTVINALQYAVDRVKFYDETLPQVLPIELIEKLIRELEYSKMTVESIWSNGYDTGYENARKE